MFYCPTPFLPVSVATRFWFQVNELAPEIFLIPRVARIFSFQGFLFILFYFLIFFCLRLEKLRRRCLKNVAEYPFIFLPVASIYNQDYILPPLYQEMCAS
jgi:hypothetical protein